MRLASAHWRARASAADGPHHPLADLSYAPVVPHPGKIICVGLNYRSHISEMGRQLPNYPTLFAKYPEALIGAFDPLTLPAESDQVDWEVELAVVVRRTDRSSAAMPMPTRSRPGKRLPRLYSLRQHGLVPRSAPPASGAQRHRRRDRTTH